MNARLDKKKRKKSKKTYLEMSSPPGSESSLNVSCAVWGEIVVAFAAAFGGHGERGVFVCSDGDGELEEAADRVEKEAWEGCGRWKGEGADCFERGQI